MTPPINTDKVVSAAQLESIKRLALSDTGFVFDPASGRSFTANGTGLLLLRLLQTHDTVKKIVSLVQKEYDVEQAELESNIVDFVKALDVNLE